MANHFGQHALVIGGSMAGLLTARVLADYFDRVTVLERDHIDAYPAVHKSIPQGQHFHVILLGGQQVLMALYPEFPGMIEKLGAVRVRMGEDVAYFLPEGKAYTPTGAVKQPQYLGFDIYSQSRGLLEHCVRRCALAFTNVRLESDSVVQGLLYDNGRVQGVRSLHNGKIQTLAAELVVDAGGRGAHAPHWLSELGFEPPAETLIGVEMGYTSAKFRIPAAYDEPERALLCLGPTVPYLNRALLQEIEDRTWLLSLVGRFGNYPSTEVDGFLAFAQTVVPPALFTLLKEAERVTDITHYRFPTSVQRHYERLTAFPEGFLVLGDALGSINPTYGQGMSLAALQVQTLRRELQQRAARAQGLEELAFSFFPQAASVIAAPWSLAANQDFAYPQTRGERPPDLQERAAYFRALNVLAAEDPEVYRLLSEVLHLAKPPALLVEEPLRSRVAAQQRKP